MNNNYFSYLGYKTSIKYDEDDKIFYGKIEDIDDTVCFHGKTIDEFFNSFMDAVNDYDKMSASRKVIDLLRFNYGANAYVYFFPSRCCNKNKLIFTHYGHSQFNKEYFYVCNEWTLEENIFSNFWGFTKLSDSDTYIISHNQNSFDFTISNNARILVVYLELTDQATIDPGSFLKLADMDSIRKEYDVILFRRPPLYGFISDTKNSVLILNPNVIKII